MSSVYVRKRRESKYEPIIYAETLRDEDTVENMFKGWMGVHYKLMSRQQRINMISLFEHLFDKSVEIVKKKMIITDKVYMEA